jgi:hypothetical protein
MERRKMDLSRMTLGQRIVELARLATAMHLEQALALQPATGSDDMQRIVAGGAGPWAGNSLARRLTDEAHRFKDEAARRTDAADDRPHGAAD